MVGAGSDTAGAARLEAWGATTHESMEVFLHTDNGQDPFRPADYL